MRCEEEDIQDILIGCWLRPNDCCELEASNPCTLINTALVPHTESITCFKVNNVCFANIL